jgi:hypothetical protein
MTAIGPEPAATPTPCELQGGATFIGRLDLDKRSIVEPEQG